MDYSKYLKQLNEGYKLKTKKLVKESDEWGYPTVKNYRIEYWADIEALTSSFDGGEIYDYYDTLEEAKREANKLFGNISHNGGAIEVQDMYNDCNVVYSLTGSEDLDESKKNNFTLKDAIEIAYKDANVGISSAIDELEKKGFDCSSYWNKMCRIDDTDDNFDEINLETRDRLFDRLGIKDLMLKAYDMVDNNKSLEDIIKNTNESKKKTSKKLVKESKTLKEDFGDDVYDDLVDRAKLNYSGDVDDAVSIAIDEGLIYDDDIFDIAKNYLRGSDIIDLFYEDLFRDLVSSVEDEVEDLEDDEDNLDESKKIIKSKKIVSENKKKVK